MRDELRPGPATVLAQPLDLSLAPENYDNLMSHWKGGIPTSESGTEYPHIVAKAHGSP